MFFLKDVNYIIFKLNKQGYSSYGSVQEILRGINLFLKQTNFVKENKLNSSFKYLYFLQSLVEVVYISVNFDIRKISLTIINVITLYR